MACMNLINFVRWILSIFFCKFKSNLLSEDKNTSNDTSLCVTRTQNRAKIGDLRVPKNDRPHGEKNRS